MRSLIALFTLLLSIFPLPLLRLVAHWWSSAQQRLNPYYYLNIPQFNGNCGTNASEAYDNVELYLASLDAMAGARRLTVFSEKEPSRVQFCPASDMVVSFNGATIWWSHHVQPLPGSDGCIERRWFTLKIAKGSTRFLSAYFDYVANRAAEFKNLHFPCNFPAFKSLAFKYLQIEDHPLFPLVEKIMKDPAAKISPSEISEILINHSDDPLKALNVVISALNKHEKEIKRSSTTLSDFEQHTAMEEIIFATLSEEDEGQITGGEEWTDEITEITGQYC